MEGFKKYQQIFFMSNIVYCHFRNKICNNNEETHPVFISYQPKKIYIITMINYYLGQFLQMMSFLNYILIPVHLI